MQNKMYKKHFIIGDDFEYLKASRIYEKSIWKSPVFDAIKLLALEEILQEINPKKINFVHSFYLFSFFSKNRTKV